MFSPLNSPPGFRRGLRDLGDGSYAPIAVLPDTSLDSYIAYGSGYAAYATPTDLLTIRGSATKVIRINNMLMRISETTGALRKLYFIKRSAANTGGTSAAQTAKKLDSLSPDATADVQLYSVIPGALGAGVTLAEIPAVTTGTTAAPALFSMGLHVPGASAISFMTPVILRGTSEFLCANWGGVAIGAGTTIQWEISWTESAL